MKDITLKLPVVLSHPILVEGGNDTNADGTTVYILGFFGFPAPNGCGQYRMFFSVQPSRRVATPKEILHQNSSRFLGVK